jgi:hypothetical protein
MDMFVFNAYGEEFVLLGEPNQHLEMMGQANEEFLWKLPAYQKSLGGGTWRKAKGVAWSNETAYTWVENFGCWD